MIYPAVIFSLLILVVIGLMYFVVPRLEDLFSATEEGLPLVTRIVVGTSNFLVQNTIVFLTVIIAFTAFIIVFKKTDTGRYFFDDLKLRLPIVGKLFKQAYLSRFSRSLSNLIDSGVSILRAFEVAIHEGLPEKGPRGGAIWKPRYFVRRVVWHILDHTWEIEDRIL